MQFVSHIRRARPEEAASLTSLTMRSKAYWGYDDTFLARASEELEFNISKFLPAFHVYVIEADGAVVGFCSLISVDQAVVELHDLFIEPHCIGLGYGTQLWDHAVTLARRLGFKKLILTSDPNAEPFYAHRGAVRIGEKLSPISSGRALPLMEYVLP